MSERQADTQEALRIMLKYLEDRYSDQLTTLRDVDSKIRIRLTIFAGVLGLVTLGMPALRATGVPLSLLVAGLVVVGTFGICLFRTLWLALRVLEVRVDLPGVEAERFEAAARFEKLESLPVLRNLVVNYTEAVESNWKLIAARNPAGDKLIFWSKTTLVVGFIVLVMFGIIFTVPILARS